VGKGVRAGELEAFPALTPLACGGRALTDGAGDDVTDDSRPERGRVLVRPFEPGRVDDLLDLPPEPSTKGWWVEAEERPDERA
jgi:hypothetical protein